LDISDEGEAVLLTKGDVVSATFELVGPDNLILASETKSLSIGPKAWPDLPGSARFAFEVTAPISNFGTYRLRVSSTTSVGHRIEPVDVASIFVVPPSTGGPTLGFPPLPSN
jgi:hypothetical protein